jgi:AcrR family transcriptional regulator
MAKRAEKVAETRERIIEAAVRMHETVGPAVTTVTSVAEAAAVTRLTVYRHFPDEEALYAACAARWIGGQRLPAPGAWSAISGPFDRLRVGLADLYRFYHEGEGMLSRIYGQIAYLPEATREQLRQMEASYRLVLLAPFGAGGRRPRLKAAIGHAVSFWTWKSLCRDQGLANRDAVFLMVSLARAAAPSAPGEAVTSKRARK